MLPGPRVSVLPAPRKLIAVPPVPVMVPELTMLLAELAIYAKSSCDRAGVVDYSGGSKNAGGSA